MKKAISIFLSVLLLASSSGIAYAQHFCSGHEMMAKVTLGEEHLSCGMKMMTPTPGCEEDTREEKDHSCCSNSYTQVETDENYAKTSFDVDLNTNFVAAFIHVFIPPQPDNYPDHLQTYTDYHPPPLDKDIPVLYQVFLI